MTHRYLIIFTVLLSVFSCSKLSTPQITNVDSEIQDRVVTTNVKDEVVKDAVIQLANSNNIENSNVVNITTDSVALVDSIQAKFEKIPQTANLTKFCQKIDKAFTRYHWHDSHCEAIKWIHVRNSVLGDPLIWTVFGNEELLYVKPQNVTMIMCAVHGDEITPVKFCFDIIHYMYKLQKTEEGRKRLEENLVVIAPIVSPDSFFKKIPTRTNARGVDVNRNFPTKDWSEQALARWKRDYRSDKRRYPGKTANSEPETVFQVNLIKRYSPDKIISVHAPLTILDYDGPTIAHEHLHEIAMNAENLVGQMSKLAKDYTIKNYPFFPGSIGNYAGNERGIPTITIELPTSDNRLHKKYWDQFRTSIDYAIFNSSLKKPELVINNEVAPVIISK